MRLAEAMTREGVTVGDVARVLNHRPATVARWIAGEGRGFRVRHMCKIQKELFPAYTLDDLAGLPYTARSKPF